jgi:hypothetical protein
MSLSGRVPRAWDHAPTTGVLDTCIYLRHHPWDIFCYVAGTALPLRCAFVYSARKTAAVLVDMAVLSPGPF